MLTRPKNSATGGTVPSATASILIAAIAILIGMTLAGCGTTRVVFVDTQADLVRLGPDVRGTVYVQKGGEGIKSKNKVTLPEGWIAGPLPKDLNE